jgi:agmatinase
MNRIQDLISNLAPGTVAVLGVPYDENSSFMRGPALAPRLIRETMHSSAGNFCIESGLDLQADERWRELGELDVPDGSPAFDQIEQTVTMILSRDVRVLTVGGDHSVTLPILRAYARKYSTLSLLQLDAHPDLYDDLDGNRYSHATPMLRALEERLVARLVQLGIRAMTPLQRQRAEQFGVETFEMRHWRPGTSIDFDGPVYLTLDMDCLDPAYAPGVSHHEPGGFTTRDVLDIIGRLDVPLVGADIVEFNPERDPLGITAVAAVKFLKEIVGLMLKQRS